MGDRFDDEVEAALADPRMTYAVAEKVKGYPAWARAKVTKQGQAKAYEMRNEATNRAAVVVQNLDALRDEYATLQTALESGEASAVDTIDRLNTLRQKVAAEERRYDAARSIQDRAEQWHEHPVEMLERLYEIYPVLARTRLTMNDYADSLSITRQALGNGPRFTPGGTPTQ